MNTMPKAFMNDPVFRELNDVAQMTALPVKKRKSYERSLKAYRDWYSIIETERAEGRAEGREEERIEAARNFKKLGADINMIAKATGLEPDVIKSLS